MGNGTALKHGGGALLGCATVAREAERCVKRAASLAFGEHERWAGVRNCLVAVARVRRGALSPRGFRPQSGGWYLWAPLRLWGRWP
jgi:hypothetical protein